LKNGSTGGLKISNISSSGSTISFTVDFNITINGGSLVCTSGTTFTVNNLPSGATVSWSCSSSKNNLSINSSTGYAYATSSTSGQGTINAVVHTTFGDITLPAKTVWVGQPAVYAYGDNLVDVYNNPVYSLCLGKANNCMAVHPAGEAYIDQWDWRITGGGSIFPSGFNYATVYPASSSSRIEIRAHNGCGWTDWAAMYAPVITCYTYSLSISPNPSTSESTISLRSEQNDAAQFATEWNLDIYDTFQGLKEKKTKLKTADTKINISNWKEGIYIVRATVGDKIITEKMIVKH
jgi:hypothetical protein